jgi:hypothetical protein
MMAVFRDVLWEDGSVGPLDVDACERWGSEDEASGASLLRDESGRWVYEHRGFYLEVPPVRAFHYLLTWGWTPPPALTRASEEAEAASQPERPRLPLPPGSLSTPPVTLKGPKEQPIVIGKVKPRLRLSQYNVLQAVATAYPNGLDKYDLRKKSGHSGAVNIFKRLRRDVDYAEALICPGDERLNGYRMGWPEWAIGKWTPNGHQVDTGLCLLSRRAG